MHPRRVYAIFIRQLYLLGNNPTRLVGNFVWLTVSIIQWGFISKYLGTFGQATFNFITVILGALILWEFLTRIQQGMMMAFLEDIWSNNLLNFFASPLRLSEYIVGLLISSILTAVLGFVVMSVIAGFGFGYNIFLLGLNMVPSLAILFLFGMTMGMLTCATIFRLGPAAEWISWPLPMILSLISGVYYPIKTLPVFLQIIAKLFPPAYVFENLRGQLEQTATNQFIVTNLVVAIVLTLLYLFLAYHFFQWVYRYNLQTGKLARFYASI
ncbi:MAG: ABC transporter permease [Desulforhopalus sp.]